MEKLKGKLSLEGWVGGSQLKRGMGGIPVSEPCGQGCRDAVDLPLRPSPQSSETEPAAVP